MDSKHVKRSKEKPTRTKMSHLELTLFERITSHRKYNCYRGERVHFVIINIKGKCVSLATRFPENSSYYSRLRSSCLISPFYCFLYSDVSGWVSNRLKTLHSQMLNGVSSALKINIFVSLKAEEGRVPLVYG